MQNCALHPQPYVKGRSPPMQWDQDSCLLSVRKDLGVFISFDLWWSAYVDPILKKANN